MKVTLPIFVVNTESAATAKFGHTMGSRLNSLLRTVEALVWLVELLTIFITVAAICVRIVFVFQSYSKTGKSTPHCPQEVIDTSKSWVLVELTHKPEFQSTTVLKEVRWMDNLCYNYRQHSKNL